MTSPAAPPGGPPPFYLEKRPSLLVFSLLLPLVPLTSTDEEARTVAAAVGSSSASAPTSSNNATASPPAWTFPPALTVRATHSSSSGAADSTKCVATIWWTPPSTAATTTPPTRLRPTTKWFEIPLDELVDADRSSLTLHGDHLAVRLAMAHYSAQRDARQNRDAALAETQSGAHADPRCRGCHAPFLHPTRTSDFPRAVRRAPRLPWTELVESLTCVRPEDYRTSDSVDPAFSAQVDVSPRPGDVVITDGTVGMSRSDLVNIAPLDDDDAAEGEKKNPTPGENPTAACAACGAWVGECTLTTVWFFKFALAAPAFADYTLESAVAARMHEAATTRECYRFVLADDDDDDATKRLHARIVSLGETWIQTPWSGGMRPALKLLYWPVSEPTTSAAFAWAHATGAEQLSPPSKDGCARILSSLQRSTTSLPHSARTLQISQDAPATVGFLFWRGDMAL